MGRAAWGIAAGLVLGLGLSALFLYEQAEGPTHPTVPPGEISGGTAFLWSGAIGPEGGMVVARLLAQPEDEAVSQASRGAQSSRLGA